MANGTTDSEIVELIIDAKNLTSDELNQAATDVEKLGAAARKTETDLEKLKVKQDVLKSYDQVGDSVKSLRRELAEAEVSYEKLAAATKKNKQATEDEQVAVKLAKKSLDDLKNTVKEQEREYRRLTTSVKNYGISTKDTKVKQEELSSEIKAAQQEVSRLTDEYKSQAKSLKTKVVAEKESLEVSEAHTDALAEQVRRQEQATELAVRQAKEEKKLAVETQRVTTAVTKYEKELSKLNREKNEGKISQSAYIRGEAELRKQLKLTEGQVKTSRAAIQADSVAKAKSASNTDLLTTATRRLAQVYTVLLAAQKAVQAVGTGVEKYGELEAAITKVEKTTGLARDTVIAMSDELQELSEDVTPTATNELLRFAEVAGQLGTKSSADILSLVSASDALERSTNLAGDEAAELLARILQMTGEGIPAIHNLSSSVVALGNDFAVSEQDIVHMTKEIISGTREINLGSAAAVAFGTTLKELGQPAERSRTAIQRLGGSIKTATIEGGEQLERLAEITGLTADEIEKNLGERPEEVLLAFLKGLNRIDEAGGQVSTVLKRMGIDGTEATGVLSVLAGGTERLTTALKLSNEQFEAGDAHIKEAVKSYADQESALGRLANKFDGLTKKIGEAFSDETDQAVRGLGQALNDTEQDVISIMEYLPTLVEGLLDIASAANEVSSIFADDETGIGAIEQTLELGAFGANILTIAMRQLSIDIGETTIAASLLYNTFQPFNDLKIDTSFITDLQLKMNIAKSAIVQDNVDIRDSIRRMEGESSLSYEGLIRAANLYGGAIATLSDEQQASIDIAISKNGYVAEENNLYRELTAAIVRANRELEIETQLKKQATTANKLKSESDSEAVAKAEAQVTAQEGINVSLSEYGILVKQTAIKQDELTKARDNGIISSEVYSNVTDRLNESLNQYNVVAGEGDVIMREQITTTQEYLEKSQALDDQHKRGLITDRELVVAQQDLATSFGSSTTAIRGAVAASAELSREQTIVNDKIAKAEKLESELNAQLEAGNLTKGELIRLTAELAKVQAGLNVLKEDKLKLDQIENATYPQLIAMQRDYAIQLELISRQFKAGTLTKAEYEKQTRDVSDALNQLNAILGVNTDELSDNNDEIERRLGLLGQQVEEEEEVTKFMSLELAVAQMLGKAYDFTGQSLSELTARYKELQVSIVNNDRVTTGWLANLAQVSNQVFQQEQAVISETIALRKWITEVESGSLSMAELGKRAAYADRYFTSLSDNQMAPLLNAISKAKREFAELTGTIESTISDVQDRLDLALGRTSEITKRQFQREIEEMQALIDEAESYGNNTLVRQLEAALRDLKKAQQLEYEAEFGKSGQSAPPPVSTTTTQTATQTTGTSGGQALSGVVFNLQVGDNQFPVSTSADILEQLMGEIERRQGIGN